MTEQNQNPPEGEQAEDGVEVVTKHRVRVNNDVSSTVVDVFGYELEILQLLHLPENVEELEEIEVRAEVPDPDEELQRLHRKYRKNRDIVDKVVGTSAKRIADDLGVYHGGRIQGVQQVNASAQVDHANPSTNTVAGKPGNAKPAARKAPAKRAAKAAKR